MDYAIAFFGLFISLPYTTIYIITLYKIIVRTIDMKSDPLKLESAKVFSIPEIIFLYLSPLIGFFVLYSWEESEIPFSLVHAPTIIVLYAVPALCYFVSKYHSRKLSPILKVIANAGIIQGIILSIFMAIQFGPYLIIAFAIPIIGFYITGPIMVVFIFWQELYRNHLTFLSEASKSEYDPESWNGRMMDILLSPFWDRNLFLSFFLAPLFICEEIILILFGQAPDAVYRAFIESRGFVFSDNLPGHGNPHFHSATDYLCTVGSHGDPKLVKPVRYGIRQGDQILVNRQLLVANAFECWLEKHTPAAHKYIRIIYNGFGVPVARWSQNKRIANLVYILMKPLEWFFTFWLYLTLKHPENEISRQYLPQNEYENFKTQKQILKNSL